MSDWIPLHLHSQYSILSSTASIKALVAKAKSCQMPALALTDEGNLFGAVEFYKECKSEGVKPIIGCTLNLAPTSRFEKKRIPGMPSGMPIVLLVKNGTGYKNLAKLSSAASTEGFYYTPRIDRELLSKHAEGLICLSGGVKGPIATAFLQGRDKEALELVDFFKNLFGDDFYLELERHTMLPHEVAAIKEGWLVQRYETFIQSQEKIIETFRSLNVSKVVTSTCRYIDKEDFLAHEILMNVQSGETIETWELDSMGNQKNRAPNPKRETLESRSFYFKTAEEIHSLFPEDSDAIARTVEIGHKCTFTFDFKTRHYPVYVPPHLEGKQMEEKEREQEAIAYLNKIAEEGICKRYTKAHLDKVAEVYKEKDPMTVVRERLKYEMDIISSKGMCDYLLIVWDFIHWAKTHKIPMGPGRGSGAGSIILYLIGVTDVEPLRFNLFFERFINPERISYPDIDVDICMDRRNEVIDYTVSKYGKDKVAQIITFGTMKARMAIRDVGRVLNIPLPKVNQIVKLVPEDPTMTLSKALELDPELSELYANDSEVKRLLDLAADLEGSIRNTGIHAAGMIICRDPLTDHIPVCLAKDSEIVATQFSMKPVEAVGMLKIDFLGLKTLTSIQKAIDAIEVKENRVIDWVNLPLDDKKTFDLLNEGKTMGLFQLESTGMQELTRQLHVDKFEEIIAIGALYRPGPMEMIPSFIARKHGREKIENDHPDMEEVLAETYGIMVYQEQVMQIASKLAGYSLGEGDVLRRAMGKKDHEEMASQREKFRAGAVAKGIREETALTVFDKIEKFASYGFNKSHAAAYGLLSYVTAYLKANYPGEWMAALLTCDLDDLSKVSKILRECQAMAIAVLPPDVNESGREFVATTGGIRFALSAIKGVGTAVVDLILAERKKNGPFLSLYHFMERMDLQKIGKKMIELMVFAGAFDFTKWRREELVAVIEPIYNVVLQKQKETAKGILDLFAKVENRSLEFISPPPNVLFLEKRELLKKEKELMGFYVTGHPMDEYRPLLSTLSCYPFEKIAELPTGSAARTVFIIEQVQVKVSAKSQKKFAILIISDGIIRFELPIWPELYADKGMLLEENALIYAVVQVEQKEGSAKLQCKWLDDLTRFSEKMGMDADSAFDKARAQQNYSFQKKEWPKKEKVEVKVESKQLEKKVVIHLDADKTKHSDILKIKESLASEPGSLEICVAFLRKSQTLGKIEISQQWGTSGSSSLLEKIRKIPSSVKVEVVSKN